MINLDAAATVKIDLSTPFCAYTYFSAMRQAGCDPMVVRGGLYWSVAESLMGNLHEWAARHDPKCALRGQYARMMWSVRAPGDEVIQLGAVPRLA
ncbi:hypothetical protein WHZ78_18370 [Bradyrhizobium symbiodeficiens]|uniref:hypothetical protein n=1 Tax=Bradyrhizobium symbiodeficiens TaxID=1404367 RepID=UPI0030D61708